MMERRRRELRVNRRQRDSLSPGERLDLTPAFRDPFIERKEPAREADAQVVIEPALKSSPLRLIFIEKVDPFSKLADGDDAKVDKIFRSCTDPRSY